MSKESFAETAMRLGGKSDDEAKRIGKIDSAEDELESLFSPKYQTSNSPAHQAVWGMKFPEWAFDIKDYGHNEKFNKIKQKCFNVVESHKEGGTLYAKNGKLSKGLLADLSHAGYFGLLIDLPNNPKFPMVEFATFLSEMATIEPQVAGLASIHGCIGAVDPVRTFGNKYQKEKFLPKLASGESTSGFALTEPCAGSDMTALKTTAVLDGDDYIVNGEKLFITNAAYGNTIALVAMINKEPQVLITELPNQETESFKVKTYGIHALKHLHNDSLVFTDFRVPAENLLDPKKGNGLTIAYHGLNLGRISVCANAAGCMRAMLADMLPWADYRETYGDKIGNRELVQNRIAKTAGNILSSDALVVWCSQLLDEGYRGELECIIAKIHGSECQKETAIEYYMKTHGGRSFLKGHRFGDNIHDLLAPCIYEGECDMLSLAFFKSVVKDHGKKYFEPIGKAMYKSGIKGTPSPWQVLRNIKSFWPYMKWMFKRNVSKKSFPDVANIPVKLWPHYTFVVEQLKKSDVEIDKMMRKYQLKLADKQVRMSLLSSKIQKLITMMALIHYVAKIQEDDLYIDIADVSLDDLTNKIKGKHPNDYQIKKAVKLGSRISESDFVGKIEPYDILMPYKN